MGERFANVRERLSQIAQIFSRTKDMDPKLVPLVVGIPLAVLVVTVVVGVVLRVLGLALAIGVPLAVLAGLVVFGRRATAAQYTAIEGQPGAAAAVLQTLRGRWEMTPAIAFTRKQDFVHLVVGKPGVVLVGEGSRAKTKALLKQESRKIAKLAGDVPVHEVQVGDGDDQVPLNRLQTHLTKLPRTLKSREVEPLHTKLEAVSGQNLPLPKGPMPRTPRGMARRLRRR